MLKSNINKILALICLLLIGYIVYSLFFKSISEKETYNAKNGFMDLSNRNFSKDSSIYLAGEWAFYPNMFINPNDKKAIPLGFIQVPKLWNSFQYKGQSLGADAYGTYRLNVQLQNGKTMLGLKIPSMSSCYKLYINGKLINQNGEPGTSREGEVPQWKPDISFFEPDSNSLDIVVHISNYHHAKGGMWGNILLGSKEDIVKYRDINLMRSYLLFGILAITAVFMLSLSLIEKNFPCLSLGMFCLFSALREITVREVAIWNIVGYISFDHLVRLEYITMPLGILFYTMFIYNLNKKESNRKIYWGIITFSLVLIALTITADPRTFSIFVRGYMLNALIAFTYATFVVSKSFSQGKSSSGVVLIGVIIILLAAINDTLSLEKINMNYGTAHIYAIAFSVFLLCQIYVVFLNISEHYQKARKAVEAQLLLLQSQIKPHFLSNVLNTSQHLIDVSPEKSKMLLNELNNYLVSKFKYSHSPQAGFITLDDELSIVKSYIYMQNTRFDDRISLKLDIDPRCLEYKVPAFLIQPLVENSVKHGFDGTELKVFISVKESNDIIIKVRDNGVGMSKIQLYNLFENQTVLQEESETDGNGVALKNIRMRLQLYYNRDIEILSKKGQGTEVTLSLPQNPILNMTYNRPGGIEC